VHTKASRAGKRLARQQEEGCTYNTQRLGQAQGRGARGRGQRELGLHQPYEAHLQGPPSVAQAPGPIEPPQRLGQGPGGGDRTRSSSAL
jgi:hypothetical protein